MASSGQSSIEPKQLGRGPCLKGSAPWGVGRIGVGDLADVPQPGFFEVRPHGVDETSPRFPLNARVPTVRPNPSVDEGTDQPRPDRALVVRTVALPNPTLVSRHVVRVAGRETPQADRRPELGLDALENDSRRRAVDEREREPAEREDLIGPKTIVSDPDLPVAVGHVRQISPARSMKRRPECVAPTLENGSETLGESPGKAQRVQPQGLDLDRFADAPRYDPVADLGVHPRELHARNPGSQEAVMVGADAEPSPGTIAIEDLLHRPPQPLTHIGRNVGLSEVISNRQNIPQRSVDRVVLRLVAPVWKSIRQHSLGDCTRPLKQDGSFDLDPAADLDPHVVRLPRRLRARSTMSRESRASTGWSNGRAHHFNASGGVTAEYYRTTSSSGRFVESRELGDGWNLSVDALYDAASSP